MKKLVIHQDADLEVRAEAAFYEKRCAGLGLDFLAQVERAYRRIQEAPERWAKAEFRTRRVLLRQFPHSVFYRVLNDAIWIVAVAPQARRPYYWQRRLTDRSNP